MDATEGRQLEQEIESIVLELIKSKRKSLLCKIDFHFGLRILQALQASIGGRLGTMVQSRGVYSSRMDISITTG
jgi:hypothetical protein